MVSIARTLANIAIAASVGLAALSVDPAILLAKGPKGDHSANPQSTKKPGQNCGQFSRGSDEYKSCVKAQAQQYKHTEKKTKRKRERDRDREGQGTGGGQ